MSDGYRMVFQRITFVLERPITIESKVSKPIGYSFCSCSWNSMPLQKSASTPDR